MQVLSLVNIVMFLTAKCELMRDIAIDEDSIPEEWQLKTLKKYVRLHME